MKFVTMTSKQIEDVYGLSSQELDKLSADAEAGQYHGTPRGEVIRGKGRPMLYEEELVPITFKVAKSKRDALDARAAMCGETRSDYLRSIVDSSLASAI